MIYSIFDNFWYFWDYCTFVFVTFVTICVISVNFCDFLIFFPSFSSLGLYLLFFSLFFSYLSFFCIFLRFLWLCVIFVPIFAKMRLFSKKCVGSIWSPYLGLTSCRKSAKTNEKSLKKVEKPFFGTFCLFLCRFCQNGTFLEKMCWVNLKPLFRPNFMQKISQN